MGCECRQARTDGAWLTYGELERIFRDDVGYVVAYLKQYYPHRVKEVGSAFVYYFEKDPLETLD